MLSRQLKHLSQILQPMYEEGSPEVIWVKLTPLLVER